MNDVLARVSLARLCHSISRARALDGKYYQDLSEILFLLPVLALFYFIWLYGRDLLRTYMLLVSFQSSYREA